MKRLGAWFKARFAGRTQRELVWDLPFTSDEFGRLLRSGRPEDFKAIAVGMAGQAREVRLRNTSAR